MSNAAWSIVGLAIFLFVVIAVVLFSRRKGGAQKSRARVKGPFGMSVDSEASSEVTPGVKIDDAVSEEGGLNATDHSGRGLQIKKVQTKGDISVTNANPQREHPDPKP